MFENPGAHGSPCPSLPTPMIGVKKNELLQFILRLRISGLLVSCLSIAIVKHCYNNLLYGLLQVLEYTFFCRITQTSTKVQRITMEYPGTQEFAVLHNLSPGKLYNITIYSLTRVSTTINRLFENPDKPPSILVATG